MARRARLVVSEVTGRRGKVQKRNRSKLAGWLVLGLAVVAIVAPSAQARVLAPESNGVVATPAGASTIRTSDEFDWRAAGVLAGFVGGEDFLLRLLGGVGVARVDVSQRLSVADDVASLLAQDDPDPVVDRVLLRAATGSELERGGADLHSTERGHEAGVLCLDVDDDRGFGQDSFVRIAALGPDPALVRLDRGSVAESRLGATPTFLLVDLEIGHREESSRSGDDELREVGRTLTAERRGRLANLERVSDRVPKRLIHVGDESGNIETGPAAELDHRLRKSLCIFP